MLWFSSSHVWIYELNYKEIWVLKNWCFWNVVLEKSLESPLDWKEIQPVNPKGNLSWIFIGRTDAKAETPILWPSDVKKWFIWRDWCWERLKAGGKGDNRGWDGWVASPTQWTLVWVSSRSWWWTGKPGMLQSMCAKIRKGLSNWTETAKHPTIWRPVPSDSLEHRVPLSTLNSLRGCWRSTAAAAQGSVSTESESRSVVSNSLRPHGLYSA